ncbi:type II toxin-antitoxin system prevent-host-death family antitoxin [Leucobacter viscericola]|uniref:Antitoxin n=1 Tax=Leucobacter viscericola TaxID=2714935 RepID=A0A6G7XGT1_9MICO|nr:type II toxin-antitoxin system prevent-host-death family antitoxin [Leucobacter viscericola]QIK63712.1 type II toxin-antitoxin system prevent-host-death family antitoxin [Leucobacter viscericola]
MSAVTVRDLRNNSASMLSRVAQGESLTITKDGEPVASVVPLPRAPLNAEQLVQRFKNLPRVDGKRLRADIDAIVDQSL